MSRLAWLYAPSAGNVWFALRTCVSAALALYFAFWLQLDNPYWALLNVVILSQPLPGFLVVRGFARLIGTVVAAMVAILLIALFAQSYLMFSAGLIAWVALCVFLAALFRNNRAYGFVLAGYVATIIAVPAMVEPARIFDLAVARTAETALAVIITAVVGVLLAPNTTARKYFAARLAAFKALGAHLAGLGMPRDDDASPAAADQRHDELHDLVEKTLTLEQTRQYARFDAPGFSEHDRLARRLNYELLSLVSAIASLQLYLDRTDSVLDRRPLRRLHGAAERMAADPRNTGAIRTAFRQAYEAILAQVPQSETGRRRSLGDWVVISRALDLADRARAAVVKQELLLAERSTPQRHRGGSRFAVATEPRVALRNSLRAATAMGVAAAIWATHDEPALSGTMVLVSVLTTLFALGDAPLANARGFAFGAAGAAVIAFVVNFGILPQATNYVMLMMVLLPIVFIGSLAMVTPHMALSGRIFLVNFALLVHPSNTMRIDFVAYSENVLGVALAVAIAMTAFALVLPVSPRQLLRERLAGVFGELAAGFYGDRERFETRVHDRLLRLPVNTGADTRHLNARQAAFAAVNMGIEARSLFVLVRRAGFPAAVKQDIQALLSDLQQLFDSGFPTVDAVFDLQWRANAQARSMLEVALAISDRPRRRHAIRAAVAAELVAAALADYGVARGGERDRATFGGVPDAA